MDKLSILSEAEYAELCERVSELKLLQPDGFEDCCLGLSEVVGETPRLCFSVDAIIEKLMSRDGMTWEDAEEYFSFNIQGAYLGENMPSFLRQEY